MRLILILACCALCLCIYGTYVCLNSELHATGGGTYGPRIWSHSLSLMSSYLWKRCRGIAAINQDNWGYQDGVWSALRILKGVIDYFELGTKTGLTETFTFCPGKDKQKSSVWKRKGCFVKEHKMPKYFLHSESPFSCLCAKHVLNF